MSIIAAGTTTTTALSSTGNTDGTLQLQVNGTTPSVTLNTLGAVGVGSTPNFGTAGQALVSGGSTAAPTWASVTTSPAGSNTQVQYNNGGAFGASSNLTYDGTKLAILSSSAAVLESIKSTSSTSQSALFQVNNDADVPFNIGVFGSTAGTFGVLGASTPFVSTNASTLNFVNTNASGAVVFGTGSSATERFRFGPAGQFGIGGATYGTSGQVLTSGGASAAPTWSTPGAGFSNLVVFTSSTTWTVPAGITKCKVTVTGGGGGGASGNSSTRLGLQGGGAGATAIKIVTLSGSSATITIGAGGTAVTGGSNGNSGSSSTFVYSATTVTGGGGSGGVLDGTSQNGATASGGDINIFGGDGFSVSYPNTITALGGLGGASFWGGGGTGAAGGAYSGRAYGSGGGGNNTNGGSGGAGAGGVITIEY